MAKSRVQTEAPWPACIRLAVGQAGVFHRDQAIDLGVSPDAIHRATRAEKIERILPGVYRIAGVPESWLQQCGLLACGEAPNVWPPTSALPPFGT